MRIINFFIFIVMFLIAFIKANVILMISILTKPNSAIFPDIIKYDTSKLSPFEIILFSQCVTLTPGTITIDVLDDFSAIYVHAFDGKDHDSVRDSMTKELLNPILGFTRPRRKKNDI